LKNNIRNRANWGIGFAIAADIAKKSIYVLIASRDKRRGELLEKRMPSKLISEKDATL
jgi:hypothetical protein